MVTESPSNEEIRSKIVETLLRIEHLPILNSEKGFTIFGQLCEMTGRCCTHLANHRPEQAQKVAETIGRSLPHAFVVGKQRDEFEEAVEELISIFRQTDHVVYH